MAPKPVAKKKGQGKGKGKSTGKGGEEDVASSQRMVRRGSSLRQPSLSDSESFKSQDFAEPESFPQSTDAPSKVSPDAPTASQYVSSSESDNESVAAIALDTTQSPPSGQAAPGSSAAGSPTGKVEGYPHGRAAPPLPEPHSEELSSFPAIGKLLDSPSPSPQSLLPKGRYDERHASSMIVQLTAEHSGSLGFKLYDGVVVFVQEGSWAESAGLHEGDKVLNVNGRPVEETLDPMTRWSKREFYDGRPLKLRMELFVSNKGKGWCPSAQKDTIWNSIFSTDAYDTPIGGRSSIFDAHKWLLENGAEEPHVKGTSNYGLVGPCWRPAKEGLAQDLRLAGNTTQHGGNTQVKDAKGQEPRPSVVETFR
eukprot:gnl/MRDRNA2_/MRDRNA2_139000_c0_seq1.p1 gnl/MRDRNA2_/MRDRNA2_139000_c0~~gnl/MRDRNA2_/MRDRNA2_139000_c0_seq1.p1  ORF type:complete len:366 (-),score=71.01 gnl/MRDRNA2_/MRDRNA2_139000_c0_seq1:104-1201(-)